MGRAKKALEDMTGPTQVTEFAKDLRALMESAGYSTYKQVAAKASFSEPAIAAAARGSARPSWNVTEAIVKLCGGDVADWRARWEDLDTAQRATAKTAAIASPGAGPTPAPRSRRSRTVLVLIGVAALILTSDVVRSKVSGTAATASPTCDDIGMVAGRDDLRWVEPFRAAYQRAGGREVLGCPVPDRYGFVHPWAPGLSQDLWGGSSVHARIMALDEHRVVVMAGDYWRDYTYPFTNDAASLRGYPTSEPIACGQAKAVLLEGGTHSPGAMITSPTGTYIWLRLPAWQLYQQLGGPQGLLGRPLTGLGEQLDGSIRFEHGAIHLTGNTARPELFTPSQTQTPTSKVPPCT